MDSQVYRLAADGVVALHFAWILFLVTGFLIGRRVRWIMGLHLAGLGYSVLLQAYAWTCPLTFIEIWLRTRDPNLEPYSGSFIVRYLEPIVYMDVGREWLLFATGLIIGVSIVVYVRSGIFSTKKAAAGSH